MAGPASPPNSLNIFFKGFCITLVRTFNLPLCGIPILTSSTPKDPPSLIICSIAGTRDSHPSSPNLFVPTNLVCKYFSNPSASRTLLRIAFFPSSVKEISLFFPSILFCIQLFSSGSVMCMYSTPTFEQYVLCKISKISLTVAYLRLSLSSKKIFLSLSFLENP